MHIRDPGPRPRLAQASPALFVVSNDGDRPCSLHSRVDELECIEGSARSSATGEDRRSGRPRGRSGAVQAHHLANPDSPRKPSPIPSGPASCHEISRSGGSITSLVLGRACPTLANIDTLHRRVLFRIITLTGFHKAPSEKMTITNWVRSSNCRS